MSSTKKSSTRASNQAIIQQSQTMLIIHCNQRYDAVKEKIIQHPSHLKRVIDLQSRKDSGKDGVVAETMAFRALIHAYLSFWLLQWDQHVFYQNGLLPAWIYESWLRQRYEDYNFAESLKHVLQRQATRDPDFSSTQAEAEAEENIFRDGWKIAKQFYSTKKGFSAYSYQLDRVMMPSGGPPASGDGPPGDVSYSKDPVENDRRREAAIQDLLTLGFIERYKNFNQ